MPNQPAARTPGLMRPETVMAAGTAVSRGLGMVRVTVLAWALGATGAVTNVFTTANTLPNNLFAIIGGGVLNAVLVPQIVQALRRADGGKEYVDRLLTTALTVMFAATVLVTCLAGPLMSAYRRGEGPAEDHLGLMFALWCLPQIFFYGVYTLWGQVLNARGSFGPFMWAPIVNNVVVIAGVAAFVTVHGDDLSDVAWWTDARVAVFGAVNTGGVVLQALVLWPVLRRSGYRFTPRFGVRGAGLRAAGRTAGWTLAAVVLQQAGYVVTSLVTNYGGRAGAGSTVYQSAYLLFMLPHSLVTVSLATAAFTGLARAVDAGDTAEVVARTLGTVRLTGLATVGAAVAFVVLGRDACRLLYAANSSSDVGALYLVTCCMMTGLVGYSAQYVLQRVFYAFQDGRTPFTVTAVTVAVTAGADLLAWAASVAGVLPLRLLTPVAGAVMAVASLIGAALCWTRLRTRAGRLPLGDLLGLHLRCLVAAVVAAVAAWGVDAAAHRLVGTGVTGALVGGAVGGAVFLGAYAAGLVVLEVPEARRPGARVWARARAGARGKDTNRAS